jgi:hypothetical protein
METTDADIELANKFIEFHRSQLVSSGLPELYWKSLFQKLKNEVF